MTNSDGSVLNFLRAVHERPGMYVGGGETPSVEELRCLDIMLRGYAAALHEHGVVDRRVPDFLSSFGDYLRRQHGWSMSLGPVEAVIFEANAKRTDPWTLFFSLLGEFEDQLDEDGRERID